jgi:cysteine desulfurase
MVTAFEWCEQQIASGEIEQRRVLREQFEQNLQAAMPAVVVNGAGADRLWNTINVIMPEADCRQRWVVKLDKAGFAVSTGSACASGSEKPSHVLSAMNRSASEAARALRFSSGWLTTGNDWRALLAAIERVQKEFTPDS